MKNLIDQGLMEEEGYKSIEVAKENGSWSILDEVEALVIPDYSNYSMNNSASSVFRCKV